MQIEREYGAVTKAAQLLLSITSDDADTLARYAEAGAALNHWIVAQMAADARLESRIDREISLEIEAENHRRVQLDQLAREEQDLFAQRTVSGTTTVHEYAEMIVASVISTGPLSTLPLARAVARELATMVSEARTWAIYFRDDDPLTTPRPVDINAPGPRWLVEHRPEEPQEPGERVDHGKLPPMLWPTQPIQTMEFSREDLPAVDALMSQLAHPTVEELEPQSPTPEEFGAAAGQFFAEHAQVAPDTAAEIDRVRAALQEPTDLMPPVEPGTDVCRELSPDGAVCTFYAGHAAFGLGHSWETLPQ